MTKLKRVSENQISKETYVEEEDDDPRFAVQPDPGQGMTRASEDVMQRRKILKVSRRNFGSESGSGMESSASAPRPLASSNPFAFTTLAQSSAMSSAPTSQNTSSMDAPSKPNPFAKISFASQSAPTVAAPPKHTFSFTSSSTSTSPKSASSTFSFAPNAAITQPTVTAGVLNKSSSTQRQSSSLVKREKIKELNMILMQTIVDHWEAPMRTCDYSQFMKDYQKHKENIEFDMENEAASMDRSYEEAPSMDRSSDSNLKTVSKNITQSASLSWSFGDAAPPSAVKPFSFPVMGAPTPNAASAPAGTFSFSSISNTSISFGAPSLATSTIESSQSAPNGDGNNDDEDPTSNPDDGKVEKIELEDNTEEEILHEVRAKHLKFEDKKWKKFGAGVLRLYRHKTTSKHRMVIRNEIGKVQFNVAISKGMTFEKIIKDGKQGKATFAKFFAVEDASRGPEAFMLQVKPDCLDKLHDALTRIVT